MNICKTAILCTVRFLPLWTLIIVSLLLGLLLRPLRALFRMASATRLPLRAIIAALAVAGAYGAVNSRPLLTSMLTGPGSKSRIVALLVVLANFKNFPGVWTYRVWRAILLHFLVQPKTIKGSLAGLSNPASVPPTLFQPVITSSRSPIMECDYNMHKSNSTYFSDLDVTRSHLVCCILREGVKAVQDKPGVVLTPDGSPAKGKWGIMLGGVSCSFKREIGMYQKYEMWTRLLCWDRKWIYVLTHFVEAGAVKPTGWTLSGKKGVTGKQDDADGAPLKPKVPEKAIFATAISKYVMKVGRLTIHPEMIIDASRLLPPKPGGWETMSGPKTNGHPVVSSGEGNGHVVEPAANGKVVESETPELIWDWRRIEAENARGMEFAKHFAALDDLHGEFRGGEGPALGVFGDLF